MPFLHEKKYALCFMMLSFSLFTHNRNPADVPHDTMPCQVAERAFVGVEEPRDGYSYQELYESLKLAIKRTQHKELSELLKKCKHDVNGFRDTRTGIPLLHYAVVLGDKQTVKILLEHGAKVDLADDSGNTPLMEVARIGDTKMIKFLLLQGASPFLRNKCQKSAFLIAPKIMEPILNKLIAANQLPPSNQ